MEMQLTYGVEGPTLPPHHPGATSLTTQLTPTQTIEDEVNGHSPTSVDRHANTTPTTNTTVSDVCSPRSVTKIHGGDNNVLTRSGGTNNNQTANNPAVRLETSVQRNDCGRGALRGTINTGIRQRRRVGGDDAGINRYANVATAAMASHASSGPHYTTPYGGINASAFPFVPNRMQTSSSRSVVGSAREKLVIDDVLATCLNRTGALICMGGNLGEAVVSVAGGSIARRRYDDANGDGAGNVVRTFAASAAHCHIDETLSPSFLVIDGIESISLADGKGEYDGKGKDFVDSEGKEGKDEGKFASESKGESTMSDAVERWALQAETRMSVGNVSYEYQREDERRMSFSSEDGVEVDLSVNVGTGKEDSFGDDGNEGGNESGNALSSNVANNNSSNNDEKGEETHISSTVDEEETTPTSQFLSRAPALVRGGSIVSQTLIKDSVPRITKKLIAAGRYLPPTQGQVANCLENGKFDEAITLYEEILRGNQEKYGDSDLIVAIDHHNIGVVKLLAGQYDEALSYFHEAVLNKADCLGGNSPLIVDSLIEIGILLYARGEYKRSLSRFEEALSILGPDHFGTAHPDQDDLSLGVPSPSLVFNNIGCVLFALGDHAGALANFQKAHAIQRMKLGSTPKAEPALVNVALTQANIGHVKLAQGDADAVVPLEESLLLLQSVLGDNNNKTIRRTTQDLSKAKEMASAKR